MILEIKNHFG